MIPDNLLFLQAVPLDKRFLWEIEVQIHNFRNFSISDRMHIAVWFPEHREEELSSWTELKYKYPEINLYFFKNQGVNLGLYIPTLRPHTLKKLFKERESLFQDKMFFYHDSDILFNRLPDFNKLCSDNICWESNTSGYLDYTYLSNKEKQGNIKDNEAIKKLAEIGRVDIGTIQSYDKKTGGAQYLLKFIDWQFWQDVERMCVEIRASFAYHIPNSINRKYFASENEGFQSWCADMWAVNMALWNRGIKTDITEELDFSWATDNIETYNKKSIFHNAGVVNGSTGLFYKGDYLHKSPIGENLPLPPEYTASRKYVEAILEVSKSTP